MSPCLLLWACKRLFCTIYVVYKHSHDPIIDVLHAQLGQTWSGSDKSRIKYSYCT